MKNIVLTGFMAAGKTNIAKALSEISGMAVADTDEEIIRQEGRSINDIFAASGEPYFRSVEKRVVRELSRREGIIISTGGGVVLDPENIAFLQENGIVFLLDADFSVIAQRLEGAQAARPLLRDGGIEAVRKRFEDRKPFYSRCDVRIPVSNEQEPLAFAKQIFEIFKARR